MVQTILILAANPKGTTPLRLDEEVREIDAGLQRAKHRDQFILQQKRAVRPRDIQQAMLDINPQIVHFSGHGAEDEGLVFEDETGQVKLVDGEALAGLFELFADQVECVVLNGCYSLVQAEAITQHVNYVIGMKKAIGDRAAIEFAVGFYGALGAGRPVEFAYKCGCAAIRLAGIPEQLTPTLKKKPNIEQTVAKRILPEDQPPIPNETAYKPDQEFNCNQELQHNSFNNIKAKQPFSPPSSPASEFSINFPNQPDISKSQSLFTRIADHKNKLLAAAVILAFGLVVYPAYEHLKLPPQLVEDIALTQNAPLVRAETEGKIGEYREGIIPIKPTGVNLRNFTIEAQYRNPYDGAMDNWTYGFAFHENTSDRKSFDVWVTSKEKEWRFGTTAKSSNDKLPNLDVAENGSNKLRLTVNKNKATFFVNDSYIATFDVSDFTNKGDVLLIAKDGISGKSVQYENLKVWSLDN